MVPFRISLTGTNCCVVPDLVGILFFFLGNGSLYIERPRELGKFAPREFRRPPDGACRRFRFCGGHGSGALLLRRRPFMLPEEEFRSGVVGKTGFEHFNERFSVYFIESERSGKRDY